MAAREPHILVCGAGIIGAATAFYATRLGARVTLVERANVAGAASGRSGGFLALDWNDGTALSSLARESFALHEGLAAELGTDIGYRRVHTRAVASAQGAAGRTSSGDWLDKSVQVRGTLGDESSTAQVHPRALTCALVQAALDAGAALRHAAVTGLETSDGCVRGAVVDGAPLSADAVVLALGPWSLLASRWLSLPPVLGLRGHSLRLRPKRPVPAEVLFVEDGADSAVSPEIYPRPDGEVYVCGLSDQPGLPVDPKAITPEEAICDRLRAAAARVSPALADAELVAASACFRPVTIDGLPLIGAVDGAQGAYVATGHSVWGILNGPATGKAMAELVVRGSTSLDLTPFDPNRASAGPRNFDLSGA